MCLLQSSPLSHLPSHNPQSSDLRPHNLGSVHPFLHPSLRALVTPQISFITVLTKDTCGPVGSLLSKADPSTPPFPKQIVGSRHGTYPRFQLGMAVDPIHNRFAVALLISGSASSPASGFSSFKRGGKSLGFFVGLVPLGSVFFFHRFLHEFEKAANLIFHARFSFAP